MAKQLKFYQVLAVIIYAHATATTAAAAGGFASVQSLLSNTRSFWGLRSADGVEWARLIDQCDETFKSSNANKNNVPNKNIAFSESITPLFERAEKLRVDADNLRHEAAVLLERAERNENLLNSLKSEVAAKCAAVARNSYTSETGSDDHAVTFAQHPASPAVVSTLRALFDATGGRVAGCWSNASGWRIVGSDPCVDRWFGVNCDGNGIVRSLQLDHNALCGALPDDESAFFSLAGLEILDLSFNDNLGGSLPVLIPLTSLNILELGSNPSIISIMPTQFGYFTNLEWLGLSHNPGLSGTIVSELGRCTNISKLLLNTNKGLVGSIPSELGLLSNAEYFYLFDNPGLNSNIPSQFGQLNSVKSFAINPGLRGTIPTQVGLWRDVREISLRSNPLLTGPIPSEAGRLANIQSLSLSSNALTGQIPSEIGALANIEMLLLHKNPGLSGTIPSTLGALSSLKNFALHHTPSLRGQLPSEIGELASLEEFYVFKNPGLTGTLPTTYGRLHNIKNLFLSTNTGLRGPLPSHWGLLSTVRTLDLHGCTGLSGAQIPEQWSTNLTSLEKLDLRSLDLEGGIPESWLGLDPNYNWYNDYKIAIPGHDDIVFDVRSDARLDPNPVLPALREINLADNRLSQEAGLVLRYTSTLQSLVILDVSDNALSGRIEDKDMYAIGARNHNPDLGDPNVYIIATFPRLVSLQLSNNSIEHLPNNWKDPNTNATSLSYFRLLYASHNELQGGESLGEDYKSISVLDLSDNPEFAPHAGGDELPSFMVFDFLTGLPQKGLDCTCPGLSGAADDNVAYHLDPEYYDYSKCMCDTGFGGERCQCQKCQPGTMSANGSCLLCPGKSHSREEGSIECAVCKPGTCHGHGNCLLAADSTDGEHYNCMCDIMYRGSNDCKTPIVGIVIGLFVFIIIALLVALTQRARRTMLARALRERRELRALVDIAEGDVESLKQSWRIKECDLDFNETVAFGAFARVYRGTWLGRPVAVKEFFQLPGDDDNFDNVGFDEDEVTVMMHNRHPRLVLFFGCGRRKSNGRRFLVLEWMEGGSLYDRFHASTPPSWEWRMQAALDVALALKYLHGEGLVHRDVKSLKPVGAILFGAAL